MTRWQKQPPHRSRRQSKVIRERRLPLADVSLYGDRPRAEDFDALGSCKNLGAIVTEIVDTCLMDRPTAGDPSGTLLWADRWAVPFSHDPETVLQLVDTLPEAGTERSNECLVLMSRILDEARMNNENEEPGASHFFQILTAGLAERAEAGELDAENCFGLCQAYLRASLTPPDQLRKAPDVFEALAEDEGLALPDVADLAEGLVPDGSTPFETYTELREIVGAMPAHLTTAFLTQMITQADPRMIAVGRYFLLDPVTICATLVGSSFDKGLSRWRFSERS